MWNDLLMLDTNQSQAWKMQSTWCSSPAAYRFYLMGRTTEEKVMWATSQSINYSSQRHLADWGASITVQSKFWLRPGSASVADKNKTAAKTRPSKKNARSSEFKRLLKRQSSWFFHKAVVSRPLTNSRPSPNLVKVKFIQFSPDDVTLQWLWRW